MRKFFTEFKSQAYLGKKVIALIFNSSPKWATASFALSFVSSITPAVNLYIGKLLIDSVVLAIQNSHQPQTIAQIFLIFGAGLLVSLISSLTNNLTRHVDNTLRDRFGKYAIETVAKKSAELDLSFFEDPRFFDRLDKVQREIYGRPFQALGEIRNITSTFVTIISYFVVLSQLGWWAPTVILIGSLPRLWLRLSYSYKTYAITDKRSPDQRKISYLIDLLLKRRAAAEVKVFQLKNYILEKFGRIYDQFLIENYQQSRQNLNRIFFVDTIVLFVTMGLRLYAVFLTVMAKRTLGDLNMFINATGNLNMQFSELFRAIASFYECNLFLSEYFQFIETPVRITDSKNCVDLETKAPVKIEFRNVSFGYTPDKLILKNISFVLEKAKNLALVGTNGAGKTTLIKLLLRLYEPCSGQILINDIDINTIKISSLRKTASVIFQDFLPYDLSVKENIGFGNIANLDDLDKIKQAAQLSGASTFIEEMPKKYESTLGRIFEKGEELSGGQWQKIAISRAFFSDTPILIMDEPTSALDPKSEFEVFQNLIKHTKKKSLILISHRFSTVRLANEIIVMEKGEIVEQGSHEQLIKKDGKYAKLYKLQAKWYK